MLISGLIILNLSSYDIDFHYETGSFEKVNDKSIVAIYKFEGNTIELQRMKIENKFKYLFYSPAKYTDAYYVNWNKLNFDCIILNNNDTIFNNTSISPLYDVPKELKVITEDSRLILAKIFKKFETNIDSKPKISIFSQLTLGPYFEY